MHNDQLAGALEQLAAQKHLAEEAADTARDEGRRAEAGQLRALNMAYASNMRLAFECFGQDSLAEMSHALDRCVPHPGEPDRRGFEWRLLDGLRRQQTRMLVGHTAAIYTSSLSPDGTRLVTGSADRTARVWDLASRRCVLVLTGHEDEINKVQYSPDGRWIATASDDATVRIWDAESGAVQTVITGHTAPVHGVDFMAGTDRLVTGGYDRTLRVWTFDGQPVAEFDTGEQQVEDLDVSPDGTLVATALGQHMWVFDVASLRRLTVPRTTFTRNAASVRFSPEGTLLAATMRGQLIHVFDVPSGERLHVLHGHDNIVHGMEFLPGSRALASVGRDGTVRRWDLETAFTRRSFGDEADPACSLVWSRQQELAISAHRDGALRVWQRGEAAPLQTLNTSVAEPDPDSDLLELRGRMALTANGTLLYALGHSGLLRYQLTAAGLQHPRAIPGRLESIRSVHALQGEHELILVGPQSIQLGGGGDGWDLHPFVTYAADITDCQVSRDSELLAVCLESGELHIWNLRTRKLISTMADSRPLDAVCLLPGGESVVAADRSGQLHVWDVQGGELQREIETSEDFSRYAKVITDIAVSPDGNRIAACLANGELCVWSLPEWEWLDQAAGDPGLYAIQWTADDTLWAAGDDGRLHEWTLTESASLRSLFYSDDRIWSIQVAHEGGEVYVTDGDGRVRILNEESEPSINIVDLSRDASGIGFISFAKDFSKIALSNEYGDLEIWDTDTKRRTTHLRVSSDSRSYLVTAFDPAGAHLFVEHPGDGIELWSEDGKLRALTAAEFNVETIAVSPTGELFAVPWKQRDAGVDLFRSTDGEHLRHFDTTTYDGLAFGPRSGRLLLLETPQELAAFETSDFRKAFRLEVGEGCLGFQLSADERCLVTMHDGSGGTFLKLWDVEDRTEISTLYGHTDRPLAAAFSPNTQTLATVGEDGTLRLWHVATGQQLGVLYQQPERLNAVAFSPDGRVLAAGPVVTTAGETVRFWTLRESL